MAYHADDCQKIYVETECEWESVLNSRFLNKIPAYTNEKCVYAGVFLFRTENRTGHLHPISAILREEPVHDIVDWKGET